MSTLPTTKRNGKGKVITCPNAPECVVAQSAADTLSLIDARLQNHSEALSRLHEEALAFRKAILGSHENILTELRKLRGLRGEVEGA